jgi:Pvc16 N-terminal domain
LATYHAVSAIGQAVVSLLKSARPATEFNTIDIRLFQAKDVQAASEWEGISLFLYRVTVSGSRRQMPAAVAADGRVRKRPLPLDLFYLLTPWAKTAAMQHLMLAWAMRTIEDSCSLPPALLNSHFPDDKPFRPDETVELLHDPLSVQDLNNIWEILGKHNVQISASYVARVVPIDSTLYEPPDAGPAQTRVVSAGQAGLS